MTGTDAKTGLQDFQSDLLQFVSPDLELSQEAFGRLIARVRQPAARQLRRHGIHADDCEDILQDASQRIWSCRGSFQPQSPAAWWSFVQRVVGTCMCDHFRKSNRETDIVEIGEVPDRDLPYLDALMQLSEDRRRMYALADSLWLDLPDEPLRNKKRLLAAQLFFLHRQEIGKVASILGMPGREGMAEIDEWLVDRTVLSHFAYTELYWSNDKLTGYLLCPKKPLSTKELDTLSGVSVAEIAAREIAWAKAEVDGIVLRFRNGLHQEQIARFESCGLDSARLSALFELCLQRFPITDVARSLVTVLESFNLREIITKTGIWRRLVFQYDAMDELPHKQILERTAPAAAVIGTSLTPTVLHGWLSMRRLLAQLAAHASEGGN